MHAIRGKVLGRISRILVCKMVSVCVRSVQREGRGRKGDEISQFKSNQSLRVRGRTEVR